MTETTNGLDQTREALLDAAMMHVPFDGWSEASFRAAIADSGVDPALARAACPRGAVDLAVAFHKRGDDEMARRLAQTDMTEMRFRDKVALAVRYRLEAVDDKEVVRRGATLFALPQYAADGSKLVWGTADRIWTVLGDSSDDVNWYTKRASLSAVYGATVLYWLGDESPGNSATSEFLDRRIGGVMRFEKLKSQVRKNPLLKPFTIGPDWLGRQIKPPHARRRDMPGSWAAQAAD
ncbi:ubiquinone biosynthesis protein COQ9 [Rhodovulum sp. ES.010]|uniref:COQ9 family protein n=1 Tax=Rhodovulum sp. ES.010 TaxID=1882821 RepID=UPI000926A70F|nr:COQ9 family protein [Rhodovulum sp. ES.010]SIO43592.1 ubiquinone biosynthesis protein COQ9 [Rhodovulum sp. ES.010]